MKNEYIVLPSLGIAIIIAILIVCTVFADELQFPVSCFPSKLQAKFAERGYKLDMTANDRDDKSWGFIESKGSKFSIFTYDAVSVQDLNAIQKIVMED